MSFRMETTMNSILFYLIRDSCEIKCCARMRIYRRKTGDIRRSSMSEQEILDLYLARDEEAVRKTEETYGA